jgi:SAM-dependent methyltransferase
MPIKKHFSEIENEVRETEKGIFGVSNLELIEDFFGQIDLKNKKKFIDLGSGDGRVVILAKKYCDNSIGIEFDEELVAKSNEHAKELDVDATFLCQDYEEYDFSDVDVLFSYADHNFSESFVKKLLEEFDGTLYIYEGVYFPEGMKKGKTIWAGQTPIMSYTVDGAHKPRVREKKALRGKGAVIDSRFAMPKRGRW